MSFKIATFFEAMNSLMQKYYEIQRVQGSLYRIAEIKQGEDGYKLVIQIVGKAAVIEALPGEIVSNDGFLNGFSPSDVRAITYLACSQNKDSKYKIVVQEFCDKFNKMKFTIKDNAEGKYIKKTASEIVTDKNLLINLDPSDISSVSFIAGYESCFTRSIE